MSTPIATIPHYPLVADVQPFGGPAIVRAKLDDGTLLHVAEVSQLPSDLKEAYTHLFAASIEMMAELHNCQETLLSIACQASDGLHENTRKYARQTALNAQKALRLTQGSNS